jgi:hypothetical protein
MGEAGKRGMGEHLKKRSCGRISIALSRQQGLRTKRKRNTFTPNRPQPPFPTTSSSPSVSLLTAVAPLTAHPRVGILQTLPPLTTDHRPLTTAFPFPLPLYPFPRPTVVEAKTSAPTPLQPQKQQPSGWLPPLQNQRSDNAPVYRSAHMPVQAAL